MVRRRILQQARHASLLAVFCATPLAGAHAQGQTSTSAPRAPSTNAMENLIRMLVAQGTITQANGDQLIAQARAEAEQARANVVQASANAGLPPPAEGVVRVPYVPESVRKQIAEQVRGEVMAQAKREGWAAPGNAAPDWTHRIKVSGDIRVRSQTELFSKLNDNGIIDAGAINATPGGFDFLRNIQNLPILNTTQDRYNRLQVRARLAVDATISDKIQAGFRIATGDDNSPISTNQILGGGLAKRDLWLDRAYLTIRPIDSVRVDLGRFDNPFVSTQLLFDEDLGFDGVSATFSGDKFLPEDLRVTLRGGAFPLDFGSDNFPDNSPQKRNQPQKWLFSGQLAATYKTSGGIEISAAAAYHDFTNVQGRLSDSSDPNELCLFNGATVKLAGNQNDPTECNTDWSRAFFPRKGNTLFQIRNPLVPVGETVPLSNTNFLGLVYKFQVLDLNTAVRMPLSDEIKATLSGNYLRNLAFKHSDECRYGTDHSAFTNVEQNPTSGSFNNCAVTGAAALRSGNQGWKVNLGVGYDQPYRWGEWRVEAGYRYLETDAVLDSLNDSDFHLGGTNTKGYTVAVSLGLLDGLNLTGRYLSANEVSGTPLAIDVVQVDLAAKF